MVAVIQPCSAAQAAQTAAKSAMFFRGLSIWSHKRSITDQPGMFIGVLDGKAHRAASLVGDMAAHDVASNALADEWASVCQFTRNA